MGRGRAKAKQTKVARDLKYRTQDTDFGALAREMHNGEDGRIPTTPVDVDDADEQDEWSGASDRSRD